MEICFEMRPLRCIRCGEACYIGVRFNSRSRRCDDPQAETMKPSTHWRDILRSAIPRAPSDDEEFFAFCLQTYANEKRMLAEATSEREFAGARLGVFVIALSLLTYGRLDVIDDVLVNLPPPGHPARRGLAPAIGRLLTMPPDVDDVLGWVRANGNRLRWDQDAGRFVADT